MFMGNGYKVNDVFSMKLKDIMTLNEMLDSESSNGLTEDFLSLLM